MPGERNAVGNFLKILLAGIATMTVVGAVYNAKKAKDKLQKQVSEVEPAC